MNKMKLIAALLLLQINFASALKIQLSPLQKGDLAQLSGDYKIVQLQDGEEVVIDGEGKPVVVKLKKIKASDEDLKASTVDGSLNLIVEEDGVVLYALPVALGDSVQLQAGAQTIIITVIATTPAVVSPAVAAAVLAAANQVAALPVLPALPNVDGIVAQLPAVPALPVAVPTVPAIPSIIPTTVPSVSNVVSTVSSVPSVVPALPSVGGVVTTVGGVAAQVPAVSTATQVVSQAPIAPVVGVVSTLAPKK